MCLSTLGGVRLSWVEGGGPQLQEQDKETRRLIDLFNSGKMDRKLYSMDNYILKRVLVEDGIMYYPVVLPDLLRDCVLMLAHDKQGHNGAL